VGNPAPVFQGRAGPLAAHDDILGPNKTKETVVKITGITPIVVNSQMRNWTFVKAETDEGLVR
jgi:hypothetical protein